jgi:lipopolysaccharide/colanic/teichoic acid biosynthesis glycosyltransferase
MEKFGAEIRVAEEIIIKKRRRSFYEVAFKPLFDFLGALLLLTLLSPLLLSVVFLEWCFHGRGVLFKQRRVGKNRKIFWVYKFRSMSNKKDKDGNLLPDKDRITKFGKFIRKTSIDELPQLFNILKGQMSFIGPRPKDIKECVFFNDRQCQRYLVKPGITGLQQVCGRNKLTFEGVVELDLKYIKKITFFRDLGIFFKTFYVVLSQKDIDSGNQSADNFCYYYNDLLLQRGDIDRREYDARVEFSKTLKVGKTMPSLDEQRRMESIDVARIKAEVMAAAAKPIPSEPTGEKIG